MFRQECVEEQSRRLHGDIILYQALNTRLLTGAIVLIVIAALLWVTMGRYARVETVRGMLVPVQGSPKIYALRPGVVTALMVKEGDEVKAGQTIAVIRVEDPNDSGAVSSREELASNANQESLAVEQMTLSRQRSGGEVDRLDGVAEGLRQQASTVAEQIALQREYVASATTNFEQIKTVVERGYVSKLEYERRHQAMLVAQQDLKRLQQQMLSLESDIARTGRERSRAALDGQADQANGRQTLENLRQQRSKLRGQASYSIAAPVSGRITALQTSLGSTVSGAIPLMVLIPSQTRLRADLFVPSRAMGFIRPGQEVRLLYDAFPYQRFGSHRARVETISRLAIAGVETGAPFKIEEPVYRVTAVIDSQSVDTYGQPAALQPGMTLVGNLILERQSFLDWTLAPIRAVTNRN